MSDTSISLRLRAPPARNLADDSTSKRKPKRRQQPLALASQRVEIRAVGNQLVTPANPIGLERRWPRMPAPLVAVVGTLVAGGFLELSNLVVSTVGLIPQGVPSLTLTDHADRVDQADRARPDVSRASTWAKSMRLGADIWFDHVGMA
jgi:hypothetical protein